MTIPAIPTRYAGCYFRSRLEARWAVFFDQLSIPWEYEAEGFVTESGPYLPDFRVQLPGTISGEYQWFEVKPDYAMVDPRHAALAKQAEAPMIVARGMPRDYVDQLRDGRSVSRGAQHWLSPLVLYWPADGEAQPVAFCDSTSDYKGYYCALSQNRHWCQDWIGYYGDFGRCHLALYGLHEERLSEWDLSVTPAFMMHPPFIARDIDAAYAAARSARFEHGGS